MCDLLKGVYEDIENLRDERLIYNGTENFGQEILEKFDFIAFEIIKNLKWFDDKESALTYFKEKDWGLECCGSSDEFLEFKSQVINYLEGGDNEEHSV